MRLTPIFLTLFLPLIAFAVEPADRLVKSGKWNRRLINPEVNRDFIDFIVTEKIRAHYLPHLEAVPEAQRELTLKILIGSHHQTLLKDLELKWNMEPGEEQARAKANIAAIKSLLVEGRAKLSQELGEEAYVAFRTSEALTVLREHLSRINLSSTAIEKAGPDVVEKALPILAGQWIDETGGFIDGEAQKASVAEVAEAFEQAGLAKRFREAWSQRVSEQRFPVRVYVPVSVLPGAETGYIRPE